MVYGDGALSDVQSVVSDVVGGLTEVSEMLSLFDAGKKNVSHGHAEMVATTLLNGSVDVWYRGRYLTVPLRQLTAWFRNPVEIGAERFHVAEPVFRRWMDSEQEQGAGHLFLQCSHADCKQRRMLTFYDPREMQQMERRVASEIWYCHRHRLVAWEASQSLSDEYRELLALVYRSPGCNREQLKCLKRDTDFLMSIGLLTSAPPASGGRKAYAFRLTSQGTDIVRAQGQ
ncbi:MULTISPECIES: hypothetical protein [Burkholderia]|uniref:hypothetical protein n=1 Tax=Burkholderia TaxID=32008 RepID=UPI00098F5343|nr:MULTISPECIES: hypothetical protein [Burkholderia cepacia complex]NHV27106.1 hypothetical protein [Burkholderia sp. D-99]MBJ9731919.1 hypothetical protein [Burkholderia cenocepacia]MBR8397109.1 hypothetical protein [Burkholderia cenocepacia]MDN7530632.1 hypothetical protein [Burkholderia orbicola]UJH76601.1 hypothetical protein L0U95_17920 [Burkholderia cenocepacia]